MYKRQIVSLSAADAEKGAFEHKPGSAENMGAFTLPANCDEMDYSAALSLIHI